MSHLHTHHCPVDVDAITLDWDWRKKWGKGWGLIYEELSTFNGCLELNKLEGERKWAPKGTGEKWGRSKWCQ